MERIIKSGTGWRIGRNRAASEHQGLLGGDNWACELTQGEWQDFCRLLDQLSESMNQMAEMLMESEKITCEAQSDLLWMEVSGYPEAYSLRFILNAGRRCEGEWPPSVVPDLIREIQKINVF